MRSLALIAILAVAGVAAWLLLGRSDTGSEDCISPARPLGDPHQDPPVLAGSPKAPVESATGDQAAPRAQRASGSGEQAARHVVTGQLVGWDPQGGPAAEVVVTGFTADHQPPDVRPHGTADRSGGFSIDVTPIFDAGKVVVDLEVSVEHPDYVPASVRLPVTQGEVGQGERRYVARVE